MPTSQKTPEKVPEEIVMAIIHQWARTQRAVRVPKKLAAALAPDPRVAAWQVAAGEPVTDLEFELAGRKRSSFQKPHEKKRDEKEQREQK